MKKIAILGTIVCMAFNMPKLLVADYRDAYIGNYLCKSTCSELSHGNNGKQNDVINDDASISISKDAADSVLQIKLGSNILKVKLRNKSLKALGQGAHYGGTFFSTDSLDFVFNASRASSCRYKGKKQ